MAQQDTLSVDEVVVSGEEKRTAAITKQELLSSTFERNAYLLPAILIVLFLSIFPLIVSLYLSLARVEFVQGGFKINFRGAANYERLFFGRAQRQFLGNFGDVTPLARIVMLVIIALFLYWIYRHIRKNNLSRSDVVGTILTTGVLVASFFVLSPVDEEMVDVNYLEEIINFVGINAEVTRWLFFGVILLAMALPVRFLVRDVSTFFSLFIRILVVIISSLIIWLMIVTGTGGGLPGTIAVTLIFVFFGVALQYVIGLGLAMLVTQNLPGKRFFRVIFLLPMMITPVGIGFVFRMVTNTLQGPIAPLWRLAGLQDFSWTETAGGARAAIIIGDTWQWVPFVFIVLLAALEGIPREPFEAALVDGANRWQMFRYIILPQIVPVSTTVILIRIIETFKIIDMPQVLTYGGPGTATESLTLQTLNAWRALDLGGSAAMAYVLLFLVTFFALVFVNFIRKGLMENI